MRTLIVEDEFTARLQLKFFLEEFSTVDVAMDGQEALCAVELAQNEGKPYDLICLDINMPEMDGHEVLKKIRQFETEIELSPRKRSKIFMTTAQVDAKTLLKSYDGLCDEFLAKPVESEKLVNLLKSYNLIQ